MPPHSDTAFHLKGNMMTLTVMHLINPAPDAINKQLGRTISESPNLFRSMPVVIDLTRLHDHSSAIDFNEITQLLREYGLVPVGVCNANDAQQQAASHSGLGTLSSSTKASTPAKPRPTHTSTPPLRPVIINNPVRSGQQIYAKNTDLIILASVSNGAEILADGHIHVYGTLRGRALAGVQGDEQSRIFALGLHAELISIAGHYRLQEGLDGYDIDSPVCVFLSEEKLQMQPLSGLMANA